MALKLGLGGGGGSLPRSLLPRCAAPILRRHLESASSRTKSSLGIKRVPFLVKGAYFKGTESLETGNAILGIFSKKTPHNVGPSFAGVSPMKTSCKAIQHPVPGELPF